MGSGAHQSRRTGPRIRKPDAFLLGGGSGWGDCLVFGGQGLSRWRGQWNPTARGCGYGSQQQELGKRHSKPPWAWQRSLPSQDWIRQSTALVSEELGHWASYLGRDAGSETQGSVRSMQVQAMSGTSCRVGRVLELSRRRGLAWRLKQEPSFRDEEGKKWMEVLKVGLVADFRVSLYSTW